MKNSGPVKRLYTSQLSLVILVATASNKVAFSVSGPGEIVGVDNGSSPDTTSYKEHSRAAFSGKVLVIVQATGKAGIITVTAKSNGLSSGDITVAAE